MNAPWQIRLLGTLSARQGDAAAAPQEITRFATSRAAALLARLALFPQRAHPREELADLLWPDADAAAARLNLRVALASLRRQMEPPGSPPGCVLVADRSTVRLHPLSCRSDAAEFEAALREAARASDSSKKRDALDRALALYGGELLPGFYDEWVSDERERLAALHEEALFQRGAVSSPEPPAPPPVSAPAPPPAAAGEPQSFPLLSPPLLNFPLQFTRFFGREAEGARLGALLCDPAVRLVTLLGPGGAGKTRLALETARQVAGRFGGPACFVPLADIDDAALLAAAVAAALCLPAAGDAAPRERVAARLAGSESLLVLDNLEHLGEEGAMEVRALLEDCPGLTCLVTSRRHLNLEGERELPLSPLPAPAGPEEPGRLVTYASVQLFVDRAQAVRPDFQVTRGNADAVAAVCRSLEGLPLALELAAARISALTPGQMQEQLRARLDFLTSRRRDLPPRHRSLRAALEWSAQGLTPEQARFFIQLSVFRGGWTRESAAAVCGAPDPLPLLEQLCEQSLITAEDSAGEDSAAEDGTGGMRFRMLESLREFGEEQLSAEDRQALARRHAAYFQGLAGEMDALWCGPGQKDAQEVLDAEQDNLRAALSWCQSDQASSGIGLQIASSLGDYWTVRGLLREGLGWLEGALAGPGPEAARADALAMSGWLTGGLCDYPKAEALLTEAVSLLRGLGDKRRLAAALRMRGVVALWDGRHPPSADLGEALALSRGAGDDASTAIVLNSLGVMTEQWERDKPKAQGLYEEALAMFLRLGDQQRASYCLHNLGNIAHDAGQYDRAIALGRQSLALADALGDHWHRAYCLRSLGDALMGGNDLSGAARLLEDGTELSRRLGDRSTEAGILLSLATVRRRQGDGEAASALARAALLLYRDMNHAISITECWMNLADTAAAFERWADAAALLSAADAGRTAPAEDEEAARCDRLHRSACAHLAPAAFQAAWKRGRTLTCDAYGLR